MKGDAAALSVRAQRYQSHYFSTTPRIVNNKILPNHFPCCLELWMYHTPFTWYEQENVGCETHFEPLPGALWFLRLFTL
jgi:hypothetical protein